MKNGRSVVGLAYTTRTCDDRGIEQPVRRRGPRTATKKRGGGPCHTARCACAGVDRDGDASRNNPFSDINKTTGRGLAIVDAPTGSLVSCSTAPAGVDRHRGLPRSDATRRRAHVPDAAGRSRGRAAFSLVDREWRVANGEWRSSAASHSLFAIHHSPCDPRRDDG